MDDFNWNGNFFDDSKSKDKPDRIFDHSFVLFLLVMVAVLGIATFFGCAKEMPPEIDKTPYRIDPPKAVCVVTTSVITLPEPNNYSVKIEWRGCPEGSPFLLYRQDRDGALRELAMISAGVDQFQDKTVTAGESYKYLVATQRSNEPAFLGHAAVDVPRDRVVSGEAPLLTDLRGINRLFLQKGAVLFTLGGNRLIEANQLFSDSGTISTFPMGAKAGGLVLNGRSGGSIRVLAKRGEGRLSIQARGEAGGDGRDGANGAPGTNGASGQAGDWGMNPALYNVYFRSFVDSFGANMRRFPKPPSDSEWQRSGPYPFYICARPPTDGSAGGNGGPGKDGGPGGSGGDSGRVFVSVAEGHDLVVDVSSEPGLPGLGGRGGKGGPGGMGGPPGPQDQGHRCPPAKSGPNGQAGVDGRQGFPGAPGKQERVCVKIGNQTFYQCDELKN